LWHIVCITVTGDVYAFAGNQFGQLGTGGDQVEMFRRLLIGGIKFIFDIDKKHVNKQMEPILQVDVVLEVVEIRSMWWQSV
jgi:alpha-tubulin suppressor-like RCC1 family protein